MTLIDHSRLTAGDLLGRRYAVEGTGTVPSDVLPDEAWTEVIRQQLAHRSVRDFADRQVDDEVLRTVFAAAQSAPTSSNLQPWSVVVVRDPGRKAGLATLAGDQQFIRDAPVFTVWVVDLARTDLIAAEHGRRLDGSDYLDPALVGFIDAALAAQNASLAAESLGLGTVFVGAVRNRPEEIADELALPPRTIPIFGLSIGYPAPSAARPKPRLPQSAVFHRERYDVDTQLPAVLDYERTMARFYAGEGPTASWISRVLSRLANAGSLKGRERLRETFVRRGLPMR